MAGFNFRISSFCAAGIFCALCFACQARAQNLPESFTGTWTYVDSTGGFTGWGDLDYDIDQISISPESIYEEFRGGRKVSSTAFTAIREVSIYTGREEWTIQMEGRIPMSLRFDGGRLVLSQEVHDGFQYRYVPGSSSTPVMVITDGTMEFSWESRPGTTDQVEWSEDLKSWHHDLPGSTFVGTSGSGRFRYAIKIHGAKRYFRIRRSLSSEK